MVRSSGAGVRPSFPLLLIALGQALPVQPADAQEVGERFRDCATCPIMVVVPPGSFMMGSRPSDPLVYARPRHLVTIESPFAVGVHEVTFAQWDACVQGGGCRGYLPPESEREGDRHPVSHVSWEDAWAYTEWLSGQTGEEYRLLSEAEWEYAARAGTQTERYWGDGVAVQCDFANGNGDDVPCHDYHPRTAPVGSFRANAFGLYDVLGNVSEWTEDCWNEDYAGAPTDGSAWRAGNCGERVLRGGSWRAYPMVLRSAYRGSVWAGVRGGTNGFRVARNVTPG